MKITPERMPPAPRRRVRAWHRLPVAAIAAGLLFGTAGALALVSQPAGPGDGSASGGVRSTQVAPVCPAERERPDNTLGCYALSGPGDSCVLEADPRRLPVRMWSA